MKHAVHVAPSFVACATEGYFFCRDCKRVVQRREHEMIPAGVCGECGSAELDWHAPVFAELSPVFFLLSRPGRQNLTD